MEILTSAIIIVIGIPCAIFLFLVGLQLVLMFLQYIFSPFQEFFKERNSKKSENKVKINEGQYNKLSDEKYLELTELVESVRNLDITTDEKIKRIFKKTDFNFQDQKIQDRLTASMYEQSNISIIKMMDDEAVDRYIEHTKQKLLPKEYYSYLLSINPMSEEIFWKNVLGVLCDFLSEFQTYEKKTLQHRLQ